MFSIASISLGFISFSAIIAAQSIPISNSDLEKTVNSSSVIRVSYVLGFVSATIGDEDRFVKTSEGSQVLVGDLVKTVEGSAARIVFPDGTVQTICPNKTYKVEESGFESLPDDKESSAAATIAFSRCGIKSRYINKRCFFGSNNPLPQAGKGAISSNNSACTVGESLFSRFQGEVPSLETPTPSGGSPIR